MYTRVYKVLIFLSFLLISAPMIFMGLHKVSSNKVINFLNTAHLGGVSINIDKPELNVASWSSKEYQNQFSKWFSQNFALREAFIRTNSQIYYSLFKKSYNDTIIVGKKNQLLKQEYIDAYCNLVEETDTSYDELVSKILTVQSFFDKLGKPFFILITPSKAYTYPEYIPSAFLKQKKGLTEYEQLKKIFDKKGVHYLDGQEITLSQKALQPYPLFCRGGIHWNDLGTYYTAAELISRLQSIEPRPMNALTIDKITVDRMPFGEDADLAVTLNLIAVSNKRNKSGLTFEIYNYDTPKVSFRESKEAEAFVPSLGIIGGSFCWHLTSMLFENSIVKDIDFYYYFRKHNKIHENSQWVADESKPGYEWWEKILSKDVVILEINSQQFTQQDYKDTHYERFLDLVLEYMDGKHLSDPDIKEYE